jgi:hypothetical protein
MYELVYTYGKRVEIVESYLSRSRAESLKRTLAGNINYKLGILSVRKRK